MVLFTMVVPSAALLGRLAASHPRTLSEGNRLPLRPLTDRDVRNVPILAVWRATEVRESAEFAIAVLQNSLGVEPQRVALDLEVCTPAEAERRSGIRRMVGQVRSPRAQSQTTCIKCGQPLTDPMSKRYLMGPYCRASYGIEFERAVTDRRGDARLWIGMKKPKGWLAAVVSELDR
jgi:hypothetical protein